MSFLILPTSLYCWKIKKAIGVKRSFSALTTPEVLFRVVIWNTHKTNRVDKRSLFDGRTRARTVADSCEKWLWISDNNVASTMVSVSTVQPSLNQEFLCTLKCLCTLYIKKRKEGIYFIWKVKHETIYEW